ncbi:MAG: amino acid racemase, partial [Gemmatimonadaceae bacterium]
AEGAALCYRTICTEGAARLGAHAHPEVSMHTHSMADYVRCLQNGDIAGVGELMLSSARKLERAGAEFLICPDNTIHQAFAYVAERSPLPWLNIAAVVVLEAARHGFTSVGLTGTSWLVNSAVYPEQLDAFGIECVRPSVNDLETMNHFIMDELVNGATTPSCVAFFHSVIAQFEAQDCDAVVLGCTEIPLVVTDATSPLPTLDSTRLLARAALDRAIGEGRYS